MQEKLTILLNEAKINATSEQITLWLDYVKLLDKWNKAYNLTSVRKPEDMLNKHILDSLLITPYLQGSTFIDVGTGPGLPGIVLAIYFPEKKFVLLDSLGKRIRFLNEVVNRLNLKNVEIVQSRVEAYQPDFSFDGVISRAFASLQDMITWCEHLLEKNQGCFYAMKGVFPEEEIQALAPLGYTLDKIETKNLSFLDKDVNRHLIIIKK